MAHILRHHSLISTSVWTETSLHHPTFSRIKLSNRRRRSGNGCVVLCSTSSSSSSSSSTSSSAKAGVNLSANAEKKEQQPLYLASEHGWKVRKLEEDQREFRKVAKIQAEAFHQPMAFFDDFFYQFFEAEVLAALLYKFRNSPPDRYACLVAESSSDANSESNKKLVGVVDVTALRDNAVLQHLHGADEYLYVSGLAVSKRFRRKKIGSCLLKACEVLSVLWGFKYLALRAYEDDFGARTLYSNAGYRVVSGDPPWTTSWIGRKRRVLMIKQCDFLNIVSSTFHQS